MGKLGASAMHTPRLRGFLLDRGEVDYNE